VRDHVLRLRDKLLRPSSQLLHFIAAPQLPWGSARAYSGSLPFAFARLGEKASQPSSLHAFGGCDGQDRLLPADHVGRELHGAAISPRAEILNGTWRFPEAQIPS
jgi:hypothetical protein